MSIDCTTRTTAINTHPANYCNACNAQIGIKCNSIYSSSQSFFLKNKQNLRNITSSSCAGYCPNCGDGTACSSSKLQSNLSDGVTCSYKIAPQRITTYQKTGSNASPYMGASSEMDYLRRMKQKSTTVVRGAQTTNATMIRAMRPVQKIQCKPSSLRLGYRNTYGTGMMLTRTHYQSKQWNAPQQQQCCDVSTNQTLGVPQKV